MTLTNPHSSASAEARRPIAATIATVIRDGEVLLVRRANPPDAGLWGFPGGKIEAGEAIESAALRELLEETGISGEAQKVFTAVDAFDRDGAGHLHQHFVLIAVLCKWISGEPVAGDDALEARWFRLEMAVIRDTTTKERTASKIGYVAMAWAVAPMVGPTLGGLLDETFGWRAIFWSLGAAGVAMLVLCWFDLGETNKTPSNTIGQQFRAYPQLFRSRRFWGNSVCMAFSTGTFYAFLAGAPLAATAAFGMAPATLGLFMGSTTAGFMVGSFLSGRYAGRFPLATTMIAGRIVTSVGLSVGLMLHFAGVDHVMALFGPCLFIGVGNGLTMPSASSGVLSVRPESAGSAGGLAGALTVAGGAALSSLTGALLTESNAVFTLLLIMLSSSLIALLAAFCVRLLDLSEKPNSAKLEGPTL